MISFYFYWYFKINLSICFLFFLEELNNGIEIPPEITAVLINAAPIELAISPPSDKLIIPKVVDIKENEVKTIAHVLFFRLFSSNFNIEEKSSYNLGLFKLNLLTLILNDSSFSKF